MGIDNEAKIFGNPEVVCDPSITMRLQGAPYFRYYAEAQDKAIRKDATPYVRTYLADRSRASSFATPTQSVEAVASAKAAKKSSIRKRYVLIILVALLALISVAIPFVSSMGVIADYIDIEQDVLAIDVLFSEAPTLESITAEIPLIILALYIIFMAIIFILSVIAIFNCKKIGVGLLAFISFVLGIGYLITILPDLITYFNIDGLLDEYGKLGMIGLPLLIMIFSSLRYKKNK